MSDLRKLRDGFMDALAAYYARYQKDGRTFTDDPVGRIMREQCESARALLAALEAKPEPPEPAERPYCPVDTPEKAINEIRQGGQLSPYAEFYREEALRLVAELRAERDALKEAAGWSEAEIKSMSVLIEQVRQERDALKARIKKMCGPILSGDA